MYKITYRGKAHKFASLESAKEAAQAIFAATGIIVAIEAA